MARESQRKHPGEATKVRVPTKEPSRVVALSAGQGATGCATLCGASPVVQGSLAAHVSAALPEPTLGRAIYFAVAEVACVARRVISLPWLCLWLVHVASL